jgi:hypothetical protein
VASRKDEKERLREARLQAESAEARSQRKRLMLGYAVAGVISLIVLAGIVLVIAGGGDGESGGDGGDNVNLMFGVVPDGVEVDDREGTAPPPPTNAALDEAAEQAGCEVRRDLEDEGNAHLRPGDPEPDYATNPPTSGDHLPNPLADGAFATTPPVMNSLHALEHGRVQIQYSPELPEDAQLELKGLFEDDRAGMILFPNDDMPYEVAAVAWTQMLACEGYEGEATIEALRAFTAEFRGRGPEAVALEG